MFSRLRRCRAGTRWSSWKIRDNYGSVVLRVAWYLSFAFNRMWFLTIRPLIGVSSQSRPSDRTDGVSSWIWIVTNKSKYLTYTVVSSLVCTSPLAVMTFMGFLNTVTVCSSAAIKFFLLSGMLNKLSFLWFDWRWSTNSKMRRMLLCFRPGLLLSSNIFFDKFQASLRAHLPMYLVGCVPGAKELRREDEWI